MQWIIPFPVPIEITNAMLSITRLDTPDDEDNDGEEDGSDDDISTIQEQCSHYQHSVMITSTHTHSHKT